VYESDAVIPAGGSISDPITGDGSGKGIFGFFIGYIDDIEFEGNQISFGWGKGFKINLITSGNQHNPDVGAFSDGGFVVSWKAETGSGANETGGVYLRLSDQITSTPGVCVNYNNFNKLHC